MSRNLGDSYFNSKVTKALLLLESTFVLALALYMIALGFTHDKEWAPYLGVIGMALAGSGGLFVLARGVKEGKRWATSPAILANLIALGVAKYQFEAELYILAVPMVIVAVLIILGCIKIIKDGAEGSTDN
jgi:hypothetical protein